MKFSIVTPSFNQLDWLQLCVASVRDQVREMKLETGKLKAESSEGSTTTSIPQASSTQVSALPSGDTLRAHKHEALSRRVFRSQVSTPSVSVEHLIQDAGTPGIEEFAREVGADFYRDGTLVFNSHHPSLVSQHYRIAVYSESDAGMYDAVNKGFQKADGDVLAYLNCDEQYLPGTLAYVSDLFAIEAEVDVLFGDAIIVDPEGKYLCDRRVMVPSRMHTLVSGNLSIFTSSTFSRASVFKTLGIYFDDAFKNSGDAEWALQLVAESVPMKAVRFRASVFTDTGDNLNMRPSGLREKKERRARAPGWAKICAPFIVAFYRLRRFLAGIYKLTPHAYEIFTAKSPQKRTRFEVTAPSFRWPGR